jgi:hypothetical protein
MPWRIARIARWLSEADVAAWDLPVQARTWSRQA